MVLWAHDKMTIPADTVRIARAALNALAVVAPEGLLEQVTPDWMDWVCRSYHRDV